jgi:hypothetical protein
VRSLVQLHGGSVTGLGSGSTLTVRLPLAEGSAAIPDVADVAAQAADGEQARTFQPDIIFTDLGLPRCTAWKRRRAFASYRMAGACASWRSPDGAGGGPTAHA